MQTKRPCDRPQPAPGSRVSPSLPVRILTSYARSDEDLQLFSADLAAASPARHLEWEDVLEAVSSCF
jgi:hypothetical protein